MIGLCDRSRLILRAPDVLSDVQRGEEGGGPGVVQMSWRVAGQKLGRLTQGCLL